MKINIKLTPVDERGWTHWIAPVLVVAVIVVIGVRILTQSHALSSPAIVVAPPKQEITNANNGQNVRVRPGTDVVVDLSSVYWAPGTPPAGQSEQSTGVWQNFSTSVPTVLSLVGNPSYSRTQSTTSAAYNLTSIQSYKALIKGRSTVKASSITTFVCGSGIACPALAHANYFSATVVVAGKPVTTTPKCTPKPGSVCPD